MLTIKGTAEEIRIFKQIAERKMLDQSCDAIVLYDKLEELLFLDRPVKFEVDDSPGRKIPKAAEHGENGQQGRQERCLARVRKNLT